MFSILNPPHLRIYGPEKRHRTHAVLNMSHTELLQCRKQASVWRTGTRVCRSHQRNLGGIGLGARVCTWSRCACPLVCPSAYTPRSHGQLRATAAPTLGTGHLPWNGTHAGKRNIGHDVGADACLCHACDRCAPVSCSWVRPRQVSKTEAQNVKPKWQLGILRMFIVAQ